MNKEPESPMPPPPMTIERAFQILEKAFVSPEIHYKTRFDGRANRPGFSIYADNHLFYGATLEEAVRAAIAHWTERIKSAAEINAMTMKDSTLIEIEEREAMQFARRVAVGALAVCIVIALFFWL